MHSRQVTLFSLLLIACSSLRPTSKESGLSALSFEIVPPTRELPVGRDNGLWVAIKNNGTQPVAFGEILRESSQQLDNLPEEGIEWSDYCGGCDLIHTLAPGNTFFAGVNVHPQRVGSQSLQVNMNVRLLSAETLGFLNEQRRMTATTQVVGCATDTCAPHDVLQGAVAFAVSPVSFAVRAMSGPGAHSVWTTIRNESSSAIAFMSTTFGNCGWFVPDGVEEPWMQIHKHLLLPGEAYQTPLYVGVDYDTVLLSRESSVDMHAGPAESAANITLDLRRVSTETLTLLDEYVFHTSNDESVTPR
jgi:hypothetical protein